MIGLRTKSNELTMDVQYKIVLKTVDWAKNFFTPPHTKKKNTFVITVGYTEKMVYGEYEARNNWLYINLAVCKTIKDIVTTTIHEYTHFCQDLKHYGKYTKQVGYDDNPLEVEARENELYYMNCWRSIKTKFN